MWFGGTGCLTLLALILIFCTGGMIIPVIIIGVLICYIVGIANMLLEDAKDINNKNKGDR